MAAVIKMNIYTIKAIKVEATTSSLSFWMALLCANRMGRETFGIKLLSCNIRVTVIMRWLRELFLSSSEFILFYCNAQMH